jgi:quercetin dioxygenase-like cupin family protein
MKKRVVTLEEAYQGVLHGNAGLFRILIDEEISGAKNFALSVNTTNSGVIGEPHTHEVEQCTYILKGKGRFYQEGEVYTVGPGTAIYSPAGVPHRLDPIGKSDLTYVVIYAPSGPEKELKTKGADAFRLNHA